MAKGLGILGVILGHHLLAIGLANPYPIIVSWFWSFHMPMFFIISGYFIKQVDVKKTIIKGIKHLIIPYYITCFWGALTVILLVTIKNGVFEGPSLIEWLSGLLCFKSEYEQMAMWFLPVLFFSRFFYVILKQNIKRYYDIIIVISFCLLLWIKNQYSITSDGFILVIVKSIMATFFVFVGTLLRRFNFLEVKISNYYLIYILLVLSFAPFVEVDLGSIYFPFGLFSAFNTIVLSISVILFFKWFEECQFLLFNPIKKYLLFSGKHSLSFLCLHAFLYTIQFHKFLPFTNPLYHGIIVTILISMVVYIYFNIVEKIRFVKV